MKGGKKTLICFVWGTLILLGLANGVAAGESRQERLAKAEAMFQERCKSAGKKIYRTVENVEGILLMKIRLGETNYGDQFRLDDPYGHDSTKDEYIKSFLFGRDPDGNLASPDRAARSGYRYVEVVDTADTKKYRYTGRMDEPWKYDSSYSKTYKRFVLDKTAATGASPRYGITFDDISTRDEREYWIAGSSLKVIDLRTNEVIAERIGYMMDREQGNKSGGRSPWLLAAAIACPPFLEPGKYSGVPASFYQTGQARNFVENVLRPKTTQ